MAEEDEVPAEYLRPRGEALPPVWFVEKEAPPVERVEPGLYPLWRVLVAAALAVFALWNIVSYAIVASRDGANPYLALDTMWLAVVVCGAGGAIWWVLRRR